MIKIGVTGGIGSGKSVVSALLSTYDIPVYIADLESKALLIRSQTIREQLTALLGDDIYDTNGLNRKRMASLIFSNSRLLEKVNNIIHPEVARHFKAWSERQTYRYVVLESAILFESGFNQLVDTSLLVYAPQETRIRRAIARDKVTEAEVRQRIQNQQPDEQKKAVADYIIYNDGNQPLIPQIEEFLVYLSKKTTSHS